MGEATPTFRDEQPGRPRPAELKQVRLPRREAYFASPADWRDEVLYFLLPDRFSDGGEAGRPMLDRANVAAARPPSWHFGNWADSGTSRFQGGTIRGIRSKLPYLRGLGVTTAWVGPVFKQRGHFDTYHGYGIQDFLEVDPRFGSRADLVELVDAAHGQGIRIILDIIFNHSGFNWLYPGDKEREKFRDFPGHYDLGPWLDRDGKPRADVVGDDDGAWPRDFQEPRSYTRAGTGSLDDNEIGNARAQHKRTDFENLRDFNLDDPRTLSDLAEVYKYWIALTDCDGFRIDTVKHVSFDQARDFCGAVKEFAANLGKEDFFLVGEVAGGNTNQDRFLEVLGQNMNAALDIGEMRPALTAVGKGLAGPGAYFPHARAWRDELGSHRNSGRRHVSILDDHDHVFGTKLRFSTDASSDHQVVAGVAIQLFSLGIPCIYYGTEQAFAGPEPSVRQFVPEFGKSDRYLREAMFGPERPRARGRGGLAAGPAGLDPELPGFGPFGTAGRHCFDPAHPAYVRIAALAAARARYPVLRKGRQYLRPVTIFGGPVGDGAGELIGWSRVLTDEEALCVVNPHGKEARGGDVVVDAGLNNAARTGDRMTVVANTAQAAAAGAGFAGTHRIGSTVPVRRGADGTAFVEIRDVGPSEVLVLMNFP